MRDLIIAIATLAITWGTVWAVIKRAGAIRVSLRLRIAPAAPYASWRRVSRIGLQGGP